MINKEHKYREELFNLLKPNLSEIDDNDDVLSLLREIFTADIEEINNEEIIKKLTDLWAK